MCGMRQRAHLVGHPLELLLLTQQRVALLVDLARLGLYGLVVPHHRGQLRLDEGSAVVTPHPTLFYTASTHG